MNNKIKVLVADDNVAFGMIICEFLESQSGVIFEYDEKLVRWLVEKVTVFEDKAIVEFKSSSCIEVKM